MHYPSLSLKESAGPKSGHYYGSTAILPEPKQRQTTRHSDHGSQIAEMVAIRPTRKRYFILAIFVLLCALKNFHWICLASITNIVASYYEVSNVAVNWTAVLFMVTFLIFAIPISWLIDLIGLRNSVLIGSTGISIGVIVKCFSCHRDGFALSMFGHLLVGLAEPWFFSIYSQVASVWFPDSQVGLATSIGLMGDQIGIALGFIIPSLVVGDDPKDFGAIETGLFWMYVGLASLTVANTLMIVLFFDKQPEFAPGVARYKQMQVQLAQKAENPNSSIVQTLVSQMRQTSGVLGDANFWLLLVSFGINVGTNYAVHTILNQLVLAPFFPPSLALGGPFDRDNATILVGNSGLLLILAGLVGSVSLGYVLDKWHRYRQLNMITYISCLLTMVPFIASLSLNSDLVTYLASVPVGFFAVAYCCCAFEYAVELTYPRPELISGTLLNWFAQALGVPILFASSAIVDAYGSLAAGFFLCSCLSIGALLTCLQRGDLRRQNATQLSADSQTGAGIE